MAQSRYEPLYGDDTNRFSILEKRRSRFLEATLGPRSSIDTLPTYRRTIEQVKTKRKQKVLPVDRFIHFCVKLPSFIKWAILIILSGLPFTAFLLVSWFAIPYDRTIGPNGTYLQTATWLMSTWAAFIIVYGFVGALSSLFAMCCMQSVYLMKFQNFGHALTLRIVLMLWAAVTHVVIPWIFPYVIDWVGTLHRTFVFVMVALSIFLVQGIVLELLSIRYIQTWLGPRLQRATDELETISTLQSLVAPDQDANPGLLSRWYTSLFGDRAIDVLYQEISQGKGDKEKWISYATILWNDIREGKSSITRFDLERRARDIHQDSSVYYDIFAQLDRSGDSSITQDEVEELVQRIGHRLNLRTLAQRGIDSILRKLDVLLLLVTIIIVTVIYFELFQPTDAANFKSFLMSLSLFGLAISHPLLEFVNNCTFVFGKHPYDVGDFVEAKRMKLLVTHIGLTHTNFEEIEKYNSSDRGLVVQMSNASLTAEPIINWTRTAEIALQKKEEDVAKDKEKKKEEKDAAKEVRKLVLLQAAKLKSEGIEVEDNDKGDKKDKKDKTDKEGKGGEEDNGGKEDTEGREGKEGKEGKDGEKKEKKDKDKDKESIGIAMKTAKGDKDGKKDKKDDKASKDKSGKQGGGGVGGGGGHQQQSTTTTEGHGGTAVVVDGDNNNDDHNDNNNDSDGNNDSNNGGDAEKAK